MAGNANGKCKRSAPPPGGRAKKKSRGDAIYDDPDAVLENGKSPLYSEEIDLMVRTQIKHILYRSIPTYVYVGGPQSSQSLCNLVRRVIRATVSTFS